VRATAPAMRPVDVWDVPTASIIVVGSIGEAMKALPAAVAAVPGTNNAFLAASAGLQTAAFEYGPTSLADGATYVPAAGTLVYDATLKDAAVADSADFYVLDAGNTVLVDAFNLGQSNQKRGIGIPIYCDGTDIGFKNNSGDARDLHLFGLSFA